MTYAQAANRLGCTKRSVHNYIKRGLLRRRIHDGHVYVEKDAVEQLAEESGADFPVLNRKTIFELLARVRRLEERSEMMAQVWDNMGLQAQPLRPGPEEAGGLFNQASAFLSLRRYEYKELATWADLFVRFDEKTIEAIDAVVKSQQPWMPFHNLCRRMIESLSATPTAKMGLELQALQAKLQVGQKRVREAALFWIESGRGMVPKKALQQLGDPRELVLRGLTGKSS